MEWQPPMSIPAMTLLLVGVSVAITGIAFWIGTKLK